MKTGLQQDIEQQCRAVQCDRVWVEKRTIIHRKNCVSRLTQTKSRSKIPRLQNIKNEAQELGKGETKVSGSGSKSLNNNKEKNGLACDYTDSGGRYTA